MKNELHGVKLKKSKTIAGIWVIIAKYPNGDIKHFKNMQEAKKQINFEKKINLLSEPKKRKKLTLKRLTPEQKEKAIKAFRKGAGTVLKYTEGGKAPKIKIVTPEGREKAPKPNFWTREIDLGFIKPTGGQLVAGGAAAAVIGAALFKPKRKRAAA
jgi:hypothetical protein